MFKRTALAAVAALGISAAANAADVPVKGPVYKAPPAAFNWSGWYGGVDIGYLNSSADVAITGVAVVSPVDPDGWLAGLHLGYRWQAPGSRMVWGVEADIWGGDISGGFVPLAANEVQLELKWGGSIRGVVGVAMSPTLLYLTGGAALIRAEGCVGLVVGAPCVAGSQYNDTRWGWTIGAGIAHAFSPRWTARLEYLFADYGSESYATPAVGAGTTTLDLQTHTVRAGLSWRFSTR